MVAELTVRLQMTARDGIVQTEFGCPQSAVRSRRCIMSISEHSNKGKISGLPRNTPAPALVTLDHQLSAGTS